MYIYTHTHTYIYLCKFISIYLYLCLYIYIYINKSSPARRWVAWTPRGATWCGFRSKYINIFIHLYICISIYLSIYLSIYVYILYTTYTCIHIYLRGDQRHKRRQQRLGPVYIYTYLSIYVYIHIHIYRCKAILHLWGDERHERREKRLGSVSAWVECQRFSEPIRLEIEHNYRKSLSPPGNKTYTHTSGSTRDVQNVKHIYIYIYSLIVWK